MMDFTIEKSKQSLEKEGMAKTLKKNLNNID